MTVHAQESAGSRDAGAARPDDAGQDRLCAAIEKQSIRLLILQQPLGGRDLRYLTAALPIAGKLEPEKPRLEDLALLPAAL